MAATVITNTDKLAAVRREIALRTKVYPRLIREGVMSPEKANRELALMQAIAADYERLAEGERLL